MDDDESDNEGGRNKGKPDVWRKVKDKERKRKLEGEVDDMVKSNETWMRGAKKTKMFIAYKKLGEQKARWKELR
jgi:hypothetical protein